MKRVKKWFTYVEFVITITLLSIVLIPASDYFVWFLDYLWVIKEKTLIITTENSIRNSFSLNKEILWISDVDRVVSFDWWISIINKKWETTNIFLATIDKETWSIFQLSNTSSIKLTNSWCWKEIYVIANNFLVNKVIWKFPEETCVKNLRAWNIWQWSNSFWVLIRYDTILKKPFKTKDWDWNEIILKREITEDWFILLK